MSKPNITLSLLFILLVTGCTSATNNNENFGFGRVATDGEIAAWDIDVLPDGSGLPAGSGTSVQGAAIYQQKCFACHGEKGIGGTNDRLVLEFDPTVNYSLGTTPKTIGNYWPYATTLYDYIHRAMPHTEPGSLQPNEVYALTAYLLNLNGIIEEGAIMDSSSLPAVEMPGRDLFYFSEEVPQ